MSKEDKIIELEWQYTRTWRRHYVDDGELYNLKIHHWLWDISSCAPGGFSQGKYGYNLWHKGKLVKHGKSVKELKQLAQATEMAKRKKTI